MEEHDTPEQAIDIWQRHDWTIEQAKFAEAYIRHGDAARAWRESYRDAVRDTEARFLQVKSQIEGATILRMEFMASYIAYIRRNLTERLVVTKDNVLTHLSQLAFSNYGDFVSVSEGGEVTHDLSGLTREQWAAVQEMSIETYVVGTGEDAQPVKSTKIKLAPKIGPLELIGKTMKMFTDVVAVEDLADVADVMAKRRAERRKRRGEDEDASDDSADT
jgi:hypothetical protein